MKTMKLLMMTGGFIMFMGLVTYSFAEGPVDAGTIIICGGLTYEYHDGEKYEGADSDGEDYDGSSELDIFVPVQYVIVQGFAAGLEARFSFTREGGDTTDYHAFGPIVSYYLVVGGPIIPYAGVHFLIFGGNTTLAGFPDDDVISSGMIYGFFAGLNFMVTDNTGVYAQFGYDQEKHEDKDGDTTNKLDGRSMTVQVGIRAFIY